MKKITVFLAFACLALLILCAPQQALADAPRITGVTDMGDGSTRVSWDASSSGGPYTLLIQHRPNGIRWSVEQTDRTSCYTGELICGESYDIYVRDSGNNTSSAYSYSVPYRVFNEFGVKIVLNLKTKTNDRFKELQRFSAEDIASNLRSTTYGAYIRLNYSRLSKPRVYNWTIVFFLPDGDTYTTNFASSELPAGKTYTYWNFFEMNGAFRNIYNALGEIPSGQWSWALYFDGQYVSSTNFTIGR